MATKPAILIMTTALALGLAGCSGRDEPTGPTTEATPEATATQDATPTPEATPTQTPEVEDTADAGTLPPGFPDPASLIGQVVHDEQAADGSWHPVVGDQPLELVTSLGACFEAGSGDICGYSVMAAVPATAGAPQPATAALVLLLRANAPLADGTPTWTILDAVATASPGGEPAYVESCDGAEGVVVWADPDAAPTGDTVPVLAAWGPDTTVTSLVEVDPASLSCPWTGD